VSWQRMTNSRDEAMLENPTQIGVLEKVRKAFHCAFHINPELITIDTLPTDVPQWDSMSHVTLAICLEDTFGVTLDVDDLMAMENVREICRVLQCKLGLA
jgi:acyl carrier protein